jgi:hypothetical protein
MFSWTIVACICAPAFRYNVKFSRRAQKNVRAWRGKPALARQARTGEAKARAGDSSPRWRFKPAAPHWRGKSALIILARQARELTYRRDIDSAMQHRQEHGQLKEDVSYERQGYEKLGRVLLRPPGTVRQLPCLIARSTEFQPSSPPCGWTGQPRC